MYVHTDVPVSSSKYSVETVQGTVEGNHLLDNLMSKRSTRPSDTSTRSNRSSNASAPGTILENGSARNAGGRRGSQLQGVAQGTTAAGLPPVSVVPGRKAGASPTSSSGSVGSAGAPAAHTRARAVLGPVTKASTPGHSPALRPLDSLDSPSRRALPRRLQPLGTPGSPAGSAASLLPADLAAASPLHGPVDPLLTASRAKLGGSGSSLAAEEHKEAQGGGGGEGHASVAAEQQTAATAAKPQQQQHSTQSPLDAGAGSGAGSGAGAGAGAGAGDRSKQSSAADAGAGTDAGSDAVVAGAVVELEPGAKYRPPPEAHKCRHWCFWLVRTRAFTLVIMGLILLNTLMLAVEHFGQPDWLTQLLFVLNVILTLLFAIEMVLKITGLGWRGYFADNFNVFDFFIVIGSFVEFIILFVGGGGSGAISALRTFRLLRVFKLAQSWESFNDLLLTTGRSLPRIGPFSVVLLIFMYIFSLLGMQLLGGKFGLGDARPRHNYDSLLWAFTTTFQVLSGENWNEVMYDSVGVIGWPAALFFVVNVVVGSYIVLNLFLAILIDNFCNADDEEEEEEQQQQQQGQAHAHEHATKQEHQEEHGGDSDGGGDGGGDGASTPGGGNHSSDGGGGGSMARRLSGASGSSSGSHALRGGSRRRRRASIEFDDEDAEEALQEAEEDAIAMALAAREEEAKAKAKAEASQRKLAKKASKKQLKKGGKSKKSIKDRFALPYTPKKRAGGANNGGRNVKEALARGEVIQSVTTDGSDLVRQHSDEALAVDTRVDMHAPLPHSRSQDGTRDTPQYAGKRRSSALKDGTAPPLLRDGSAAVPVLSKKKRPKRKKRRRKPRKTFKDHPAFKHKAYWCLSGTNPLRRVVGEVVVFPLFDIFIIILIVASCVMLALDAPSSSPELKAWLKDADLWVTILFGVEMALKLVAFGGYRHPGAYFRSSWNWLDAFIVAVSVLDVAVDTDLKVKWNAKPNPSRQTCDPPLTLHSPHLPPSLPPSRSSSWYASCVPFVHFAWCGAWTGCD